jgi:hypothetical protein
MRTEFFPVFFRDKMTYDSFTQPGLGIHALNTLVEHMTSPLEAAVDI